MTDYTEIDGVRTPRPKEQDVRPRTFNGKPWPFAMLVNSEATDRFVLWYIANYKYAFNGFFTQDFYKWMPNTTDVKQHPLYKYQLALRTLFDRHLINYGDKKRLTLKITLKGQVYRIYYNIYCRFIGASAAIIIGLLSVFPNIFNGGVEIGRASCRERVLVQV